MKSLLEQAQELESKARELRKKAREQEKHDREFFKEVELRLPEVMERFNLTPRCEPVDPETKGKEIYEQLSVVPPETLPLVKIYHTKGISGSHLAMILEDYEAFGGKKQQKELGEVTGIGQRYVSYGYKYLEELVINGDVERLAKETGLSKERIEEIIAEYTRIHETAPKKPEASKKPDIPVDELAAKEPVSEVVEESEDIDLPFPEKKEITYYLFNGCPFRYIPLDLGSMKSWIASGNEWWNDRYKIMQNLLIYRHISPSSTTEITSLINEILEKAKADCDVDSIVSAYESKYMAIKLDPILRAHFDARLYIELSPGSDHDRIRSEVEAYCKEMITPSMLERASVLLEEWSEKTRY